MSRRIERLAEEIRAVLSEALRDVRDQRVGFVTLTGVDLTPDLRQARVYVSRLGSSEERGEAVEALNHAAPFLRHALAEKAQLKHTPLLRFVSDATLERGSRVEEIIREIHGADGPEEREGEDPE